MRLEVSRSPRSGQQQPVVKGLNDLCFTASA
jgi:hypothetical protein